MTKLYMFIVLVFAVVPSGCGNPDDARGINGDGQARISDGQYPIATPPKKSGTPYSTKETEVQKSDDPDARIQREFLKVAIDSAETSRQALAISHDNWRATHESWRATRDGVETAKAAIFIAAVSAILGLIQTWMFIKSLQVTEVAASAAKKSADVATSQMSAMVATSRAYITISHVMPGVVWCKEKEGVQMVRIEINNHGVTPGEMTNQVIVLKKYMKGFPLTDKPDYSSDSAVSVGKVQNIIHPGKPTTRPFFIKGDVLLGDKSNDYDYYILAYADYIDIFGYRRRTGYARQFTAQPDEGVVSNLAIVNEPGYNYDVERTPEQGSDWNEEAIAAYRQRKGAHLAAPRATTSFS